MKCVSSEAEIKSLKEKLQIAVDENSELKAKLIQPSIGPVASIRKNRMNGSASNSFSSEESSVLDENSVDLKIEAQYPYDFTKQSSGLYTCNICESSFKYKQKKTLLEHQRHKHFNVPEKPKIRNTAKDKNTRKLRERKKKTSS